MSWTHDDPGQGSPAGILGVAGLRTARASKVRDAQRTLHSASSQSGVDWEAASQRSFVAQLSKHAADIELVATGLEKQAEALTTYAGQLTQIKDRQTVLERQRSAAQNRLALARMKLLATPDVPNFTKQGDSDDDGRKKRAAAETANTDAEADLRAIDALWDQLLTDRRSIDTSCAQALEAGEVLGGLAVLSTGTVASIGSDVFLKMLSELSRADLEILTKQFPETRNLLDGADPCKIADWWDALPREQRDVLIAGASTVIGGLNGIPALDRVKANRLNAKFQLARVETKLEDRERIARDAGRDPDDDPDIADLRRQVEYLHDASIEPPKVQLYLYQPELDRIVEMVGTPSASTEKVVTYSPGTFGNLQGFYDRNTQQVSTWLQQQDKEGLVAFVYKDGRYPQNPLTEANDEAYARRTGAQLAAFEDGLSQDPLLAGRQSIGIGHSWGTANVTSSELAGAHYDTVISLSGAGTPSSWVKNSQTHYADFSYPDILQDAQDIRVGEHGVVWGGRNPREVGFDHGDYYKAPLSWTNFPGNFLVNPLLRASAGLDAHNLTATSDDANTDLLDDMRDYIYTTEE